MAQFDVYANPSKTQRGEIPLDGGHPERDPRQAPDPPRDAVGTACPHASGDAAVPLSDHRRERSMLVALPHLAAPFRVNDLGSVRGNLRSQANDFVGALDAVISGI
ncbi:toxin CcdB [Variovorax guangxiensis]|uniref:Toxin CcdB n=1 Tax=Variovorax guangxiensis TaxID=1775474 RepID=A0A840FSB0_9BURK|nr:toxin CcdB [Variovorax guangxiensis]